MAQQGDRPDRCHAAEMHDERMNDPEYAAAFAQKMAQLKSWMKIHKSDAE
jgi:hypothetical protein